MKNFSLKIACVFIILMYCLAPLSALDLNQDDNNKYIEHDTGDSSIDTKDVDVADEQNDGHDKNLDDADGVDSKDVDTGSSDVKNEDVKKAAEDKNLEMDRGLSPELTINVNDVNVGEKATAEIHAVHSFSGTVLVYLKGSPIPYAVSVKKGYGKVTFKEALPAGTYTATAKYCGGLIYKADQSSTTFKVGKFNPNLSIKVADVNVGEKATAEINADESFSGTVYVYLKGSPLVHSVYVKNGYGKVTFSKALPAGVYTATVKYAGSCKYEADQSSTTFNVNKFDPNLSIKVADVNVGEKATAEINADHSFSGTVYVYLKGSIKPYAVYVHNGYGKVTFNKALPAGTYTATVKYAGDCKYEADQSSTTFNVNKFDPNLSINVDNINVGEKATVEISADNAFTGYVDVSFHGDLMPHKVFVKNGFAKATIDEDLDAGVYTASVKYAGDKRFNPGEASTSFTVKADPNLSIKVDDITEGQKAVVVVTANETVNGEANIKLNHSNAVYPINIENGYATVTIDDDLAVGDYLATVTYFGDDTFKAGESSTTFHVKEKELIDPKLNIKVSNVAYGNKATVTVTTDAGFTGSVGVKIGTKNFNVKVVNGKGTASVAGLKVGTYTAKATFKQTDVYKASTKTTKFTVKKVTPKITAKSKTFKYYQKTKSYSVTLKDNKGKAMKGQKVTLKVNGKTYSAKTNTKGVATFKITKLNKVGKNNAVITYAGDKTYNKVSKKVKITVKFDTISAKTKNRLIVKELQRALKRNHFYIKYRGHNLLIDGWYYIYTKWAVKKYQKAKGLKVTGKVDYLTALKLKLFQ